MVCTQPRNADVVVTLRALAKKRPKKLRELMVDSSRVHAIGGNTQAKIADFLRELFELPAMSNEEQQALREAEDSIAAVIAHREPVALNPRTLTSAACSINWRKRTASPVRAPAAAPCAAS